MKTHQSEMLTQFIVLYSTETVKASYQAPTYSNPIFIVPPFPSTPTNSHLHREVQPPHSAAEVRIEHICGEAAQLAMPLCHIPLTTGPAAIY